MRIFYVSDTTPNPDFKSNLWRNNLYLPLLDLGHEVIEFDYNYGNTFSNLDPSIESHKNFIDINRPLFSNELLSQVKKAHNEKPCDIFFSYLYDACVFPEVIDEIRSLGITTVNWYCNGSYQLHLVSEISPHYDWCLVPEKYRLKDYIAMGARPIYCQEAANPNIYKPYDLPYEFDVTFVGQAYGERPAYIKYILDSGIDIRVWGSGWRNNSASIARSRKSLWVRLRNHLRELPSEFSPKFLKNCKNQIILNDSMIGDVMSDDDLIKMYSRSKINLGFSTCGQTHKTNEKILQIRLRDFEVPMCGGFYMVEYMEELEEFYNIEKEIVCYRSPEELVEKIKFYLRNDASREAIRKAGYNRCQKDHTWHKRFISVFNEINKLN